jgi:hypothetical protein
LLAALVLLVLDRGLLLVLEAMIGAGQGLRIATAAGLVAPLGFLLGFFFPIGMRLAQAAGTEDTPWLWALNGMFGVLCSACAVFVSLYFGISTNFSIAAACYGSLLVSGPGLLLAGRRAAERPIPQAL